MKFTLKNGEVVDIEEFDKRVTGKNILAYFAPIMREKPEPFLEMNRAPTLKEEKEWVAAAFKGMKKKTDLKLVAWSKGKIIGITDAKLGRYRNSDKASVGIAIAKKYRAFGLGKKLLTEIVKLTKKKLKPKIIYLTVVAGNKNAWKMYEKVGFRAVAILPKWMKVRGKYWGMVYMRYKPRG
ncbi:MAG: GNAT family N-acetyltransferase [Candidatus Micrarchaeota archaeon]